MYSEECNCKGSASKKNKGCEKKSIIQINDQSLIQYHHSFDSEKPCTNIKFEFEDQRRRQFNKILVDKIENLLDGNLEELEERVRCKLPRSASMF